MKKQILICIDRDGTLIYDKKYHLGRQRKWKPLVKFLPNVISGLKLLRKIPNSKIYMITNQPGVAIKEFPLLTKEKAIEVCNYVLGLLKKRGVGLDGCEVCGYASHEYVKRKKGEFTFDKKLVGNYSCIKPRPGMINNILKRERLDKRNTKIYILGDRESDIKTAINAKGFGVLVPFINKPDEPEKVKKLKNKNIYISKDFLDACNFIIKKEK
ncbi:MAG TPA: hypothetical protein VJH65_02370 [Candidatus Nanoarchaeia archaeon]|nr:hypothetical protein [Candidatus Nanoarchaeia archaeon]